MIEDPAERCRSEICLFGREWIGCKKRVGHDGIHRNCETYAWVEGDERIDEPMPTTGAGEARAS